MSTVHPHPQLSLGSTETVVLPDINASVGRRVGVALSATHGAVSVVNLSANGIARHFLNIGDRIFTINGSPCLSDSRASKVLRDISGDVVLQVARVSNTEPMSCTNSSNRSTGSSTEGLPTGKENSRSEDTASSLGGAISSESTLGAPTTFQARLMKSFSFDRRRRASAETYTL